MRTVQDRQGRPGWLAVLRWPAFLVANVAILFLVGVSTIRESYRGWTVDREIRALEAQAEALEGRKMKLVELTDSLMKPEEVELEARRRLGWKKEGERVVVLTGYEATGTWTGERSALADVPSEPPPLSNPERWWNYFFLHQ